MLGFAHASILVGGRHGREWKLALPFVEDRLTAIPERSACGWEWQLQVGPWGLAAKRVAELARVPIRAKSKCRGEPWEWSDVTAQVHRPRRRFRRSKQP